MIRSLAELRSRAAELPVTRVAVAAADNDSTLSALASASLEGWVQAIVFGDRDAIRSRLLSLGLDIRDLELIHEADPAGASMLAVEAVRSGYASMLLKGSVPTATLMRAVLDRSAGLRAGRLLSDVFVFDFSAAGQSRIVGITDGGVTPEPDLEGRAEIVRNAVHAFHALGVETPRVALLSATEEASRLFPQSLDAAELAVRGQKGEFGQCIVDGPLGLDLALSPDAGCAKGIDTPIGGIADVLVFPTLEAANLAAKAVQYTNPIEPGHVIVGGTAPVLIPSRSESPIARLNSLAFGCIMAASGNATR